MTTPVVVKQLPEHLKLEQVQNILGEVEPIFATDRPRVVFDFSQVSQMDSAGVDMLLYCVEQAMKRNGDLKLAAIRPASAIILELTQVDRLFEIFATVSDAVDSFSRFVPSTADNPQQWHAAPCDARQALPRDQRSS